MAELLISIKSLWLKSLVGILPNIKNCETQKDTFSCYMAQLLAPPQFSNFYLFIFFRLFLLF